MPEERRERLRELGERFRVLRRDAGLTGAEVAERAGVTQPTVSKIETGRMLPSVDVVERVAGALDLDAGVRDELAALVAEVDAKLVARRRAGRTPAADAGEAWERRATRVRSFQCAVMPGLVQTADYARHALATHARPGGDEAGVGRAVAARLEGQSVLYESGRAFAFVLTEGALRTWPGSPALMLAQLDRLVVVSGLPGVRLGVVPWDVAVPAFPLHGFTVYDDAAVSVQTFAGALTLTEAGEVEVYAGVFEAFERAAVFDDPARRLLARVADDYRRLDAAYPTW